MAKSPVWIQLIHSSPIVRLHRVCITMTLNTLKASIAMLDDGDLRNQSDRPVSIQMVATFNQAAELIHIANVHIRVQLNSFSKVCTRALNSTVSDANHLKQLLLAGVKLLSTMALSWAASQEILESKSMKFIFDFDYKF